MDEITENSVGGFYLIDKPSTWTSFDVVKKIKYLSKHKKIGHAGTLDPLAEGLLIVCFGKHTKKIEEFQGQPKIYEGILELGKTTPSIDLETSFDNIEYPIDHINQSILDSISTNFLGEIDQTPPLFSAIKKEGRRLYELAREGVQEDAVEIKSRKVFIYEIELTIQEFPLVFFRIKCSKGTYIRSLVRDIGRALNSGAYMKYLKRTHIGTYSVLKAQNISTFDPSIYESIL